MVDFEVLQLNDGIRYWLVRANGGKYYDNFKLDNFIAISDNEITMEKINNRPKTDNLKLIYDYYKAIYQKVYTEWNPQKIGHAATRTQRFINDMNVGDIVLVPSNSSTYFLIGVIENDAYEIVDSQIKTSENNHFHISTDLKRRNVKWLKEVKRDDISKDILWILSAHQTILELTEQKNCVNQLLAPVYIQDGECFGSLRIAKKQRINSGEWSDFYNVVKEIDPSGEVSITSNVQSPGIIQFISDNIGTITVLTGLVFGDISFAGVKLKGLVPFFTERKMTKENHKADLENKNLNNELLREEIKRNQIENAISQLDLDEKKKAVISKVRTTMEISTYDAGKSFELQTQTGFDENSDEDKSE